MNTKYRPRAAPCCALALLFCLTAGPADAALFWQNGVHSNSISVCFVGNSLNANTAFATLVKSYMQEFEWYSGIKFTYINGGVCPPATPHPVFPANDYYAGTIRIIIPNVTTVNPYGWVPGTGCPHDSNWENPDGSYNGGNDGWGSWANPPNDLEVRRSCVYNVKLGMDGDTLGTPWRNHTLHEIGHAVGLAHEHERNDVNVSGCTEPEYGGGTSSGFMTPYDRYSVMHYQFLSCGIPGNYGHSGLSSWDQLALHILYPESNYLAEFIGNLVIRSGDSLSLASAWQNRGALIFNVASNFQWYLNGSPVSSSPGLSYTLSIPGDYLLQYSYNDSLITVPSRTYGFSGTFRVLSTDDYDRLMGAIGSIDTFLTSTGTEDDDDDGVDNNTDNCTLASNPDQRDSNGDGHGNVCDFDYNNDCVTNFLDLAALSQTFGATIGDPNFNDDVDRDGNGVINFLDFGAPPNNFGAFFANPPGPSATICVPAL